MTAGNSRDVTYFSDREYGPRSRTLSAISPTVWGGIVAHVRGLVAQHAFGRSFPESCPDGRGTCGLDADAFGLALRAEVPSIDWPLTASRVDADDFMRTRTPYAPDTADILDFVQFCFAHVATPIERDFHSYFSHSHLEFDAEGGRRDFREWINRLFVRNGLSFELLADGSVIRTVDPLVEERMLLVGTTSGDQILDDLLASARAKFRSPDPVVRRDALDKLWDAWERMKTLWAPDESKRDSADRMLLRIAPNAAFRQELDGEARALTRIGNTFHIRHSEHIQQTLDKDSHVDYLFTRMMSFILLALAQLEEDRMSGSPHVGSHES